MKHLTLNATRTGHTLDVEDSVAANHAAFIRLASRGSYGDRVAVHLTEQETRDVIEALTKTLPTEAPAPRTYKAGDRVVVKAATGDGCDSVGCCAPEVGKVYTVKSDGVDGDGDLRLKAGEDTFRVLFTKPADVEPFTEPEPEPLKVGDFVRIVSNILPNGTAGGMGDALVGMMGEVTRVGRTTYGNEPFVEAAGFDLKPECFERVETMTERPAIGETVMVTKTPASGYGYRAGDRVVVTVVAGEFFGGRSERTGEHVGGISWKSTVHVAAPKDAGNGFVVGEIVTVPSGADGRVVENPSGLKARGVTFVQMTRTKDVVAYPSASVKSTARIYA